VSKTHAHFWGKDDVCTRCGATPERRGQPNTPTSAPDGRHVDGQSTRPSVASRRDPGTLEEGPRFLCSQPDEPHVWRRRNGTWQVATSCPGDEAHDPTAFSGVLDGVRLDNAIWRRGDMRAVPALQGPRETGRTFDQQSPTAEQAIAAITGVLPL
jgi:hypothetical protein